MKKRIRSKEKRNILLRIVKDNWRDFEKEYRGKLYDLGRHYILHTINKFLLCKSPKRGLRYVKCDCGMYEFFVPHCCKANICPACGYLKRLKWLDHIYSFCLPCKYQLLTFTLPYKLRTLAKKNRGLMWTLMHRAALETVMTFLKNKKLLDYLPGTISIIHTFGSELQWHPHLHMYITAGGLVLEKGKRKRAKWIDNTYLSEKFISEAYKAVLFKLLRKEFKNNNLKHNFDDYTAFNKLLDSIYQKEGYFYISKAEKENCFQIQYMARYLGRAPIAQHNIEYDPKRKTVTILYKVSQRQGEKKEICKFLSKTIHVYEFFKLLIMHIPDRYERQIFYGGLYSYTHRRKKLKRAKALFSKKQSWFMKKLQKKTKKKLYWAECRRFNDPNAEETFPGGDPMVCPVCKKKIPVKNMKKVFFTEDELENIRYENNQIIYVNDTS